MIKLWEKLWENYGKQRKPTHPGAILREDFIPDYGLSLTGLAESLGVSRQSVNELLRERRALSPEMVLRLSRLFGRSPEFLLNAQRGMPRAGLGPPVTLDIRPFT
jgi:addiction module HigA family antidote